MPVQQTPAIGTSAEEIGIIMRRFFDYSSESRSIKFLQLVELGENV